MATAAALIRRLTSFCSTPYQQIAMLNVKDFGAKGDGVTNDGPAIQYALNAAASLTPPARECVIFPPGDYKVAGTLTVQSGTYIEAYGAVVTETTSGVPLLKGTAVSNVTIEGGKWVGVGAASSLGLQDVGLIYFLNNGANVCSNIRIEGIEVSDAFTAISAIRVSGLWILRNSIHNWTFAGIIAGRSTSFFIESNDIFDSVATGAGTYSYGIHATGDQNGSAEQIRCVIQGNSIRNVPAWDGIMSHDVTELVVADNTIENCRCGIDIGVLGTTNVIDRIVVHGNIVKITKTDTWAGTSANSFGISVAGVSGCQIQRVTISANVIYDWGSLPNTSLPGGDPGPVVIAYANDIAITGNVVSGVGTCTSFARLGLYLVGVINRLTVVGNTFSGKMSAGGIRTASATSGSSMWAISGNTINQDVPGDTAILLANLVLAGYAIGPNPTNSTDPLAYSGTVTLSQGHNGGTRAPVTLTDAPTIAVDASKAASFKVTIAGNRTVGVPTNASAGQRITFFILQNPSGGFTLGFDTSAFNYTWSNTGNGPSKRSSISFIYDGSKWNQDGAQSPYI